MIEEAMIVYLLTNRANGKRYVGQTRRTLELRWWEHTKPSQHKDGLALHNAIRKYGPAAFEKSVLSTATNLEALNSLERFWIRELKTLRPHGYNLTDGGDGSFLCSAETRARMSVAQKGNTKAKGHKHSLESRARMSVAQMGNTKAKGFKNAEGYHHTPETKARLSSVMTGRTVSAETRAKRMGNTNAKGHVHSAESRARMSAAQMGNQNARRKNAA
jgi:hypothetical protein